MVRQSTTIAEHGICSQSLLESKPIEATAGRRQVDLRIEELVGQRAECVGL